MYPEIDQTVDLVQEQVQEAKVEEENLLLKWEKRYLPPNQAQNSSVQKKASPEKTPESSKT